MSYDLKLGNNFLRVPKLPRAVSCRSLHLQLSTCLAYSCSGYYVCEVWCSMQFLKDLVISANQLLLALQNHIWTVFKCEHSIRRPYAHDLRRFSVVTALSDWCHVNISDSLLFCLQLFSCFQNFALCAVVCNKHPN